MNPFRPIMIVEDDPYIMNSMVEVFTLLGRSLLVAPNGLAGINILKNLRSYEYPCCIILDLMMPEMTGEEFIFHIQALGRVELDSIPIIVSSASGKLESLLDPRVTYKLKKPISMEHLEEISAIYK